jgi:lipopolysaccharide/colanic/teichoic acid biosynthesis glycosyltransferase
MQYIRNHSIWLDVQILFRTVVVVLQGRGAY